MRTSFSLGLVMAAGLVSTQVFAVQVPGPLVDAGWLANHNKEVVILDVREDLKSFTEKPKKAGGIAGMQGCGAKKGSGIKVAGHIPGANLVNWKEVRVKRNVNGVDLISLVPTKEEMEAFMQKYGVNAGDTVVVTSKGAESKDVTFATRLYWQIKYWGHDNVAVLDGGTAAWAAAGNPLSNDESNPAKGNWQAGEPRSDMLATTADVSAAIASGTRILDGRTEDFYLGTEKKDYVYAKGHISGAKNFPHPLLVNSKTAATFLPKEDIAALMQTKGIDTGAPVITYCDSGHLSSGQWFILHELLGNKNAKLYDGSMHEWTKNQDNPTTAMKME